MKRQSSLLFVFCAIIGSHAKPPPTFLEYKDSLGQYSFGYSAPGSARSEVRTVDGSTRGSYSYIDLLGNIQSAQYTADGKNGFQITATNLPQAPTPVEDTPEVAAAKIAHLKAFEVASKLAEEQSDQDGHGSANDAEKSADSILFDRAAGNENTMVDQVQAKDIKNSEKTENSDPVGQQGPMAVEANVMEIPTQPRNLNGFEAVEKSSSMELRSSTTSEANAALAKSPVAENQGETIKIPGEPVQGRSNEPIQPQAKTGEVSNDSDVPVVTTSFVIPGSLNFHTRIRLDQSGEETAQIGPEASALFPTQSSKSQGQDVNANPSISTPAETITETINSSEKAAISEGVAPIIPTSKKSFESINRPQEYSNTIVPGIISPSNVYAFTYGVGINPIYRHYSPYQYFSYL